MTTNQVTDALKLTVFFSWVFVSAISAPILAVWGGLVLLMVAVVSVAVIAVVMMALVMDTARPPNETHNG